MQESKGFFETLLDDAVGPFFVSLDEDVEVLIEAPSGSDIAELDTAVSVHDQLDLLVDEDTADTILEHYARRPISELADLVDDIREHFGILVPPDHGWGYLVDEINRYGEGIEKDMWGMPNQADLSDWILDHPNLSWNKLFRLLPALPTGGFYHAAIADDDERADRILEMEADGDLPAPSRRPSLVGWTPERAELAAAVDLLQHILHGVWGASPKFKGKGGRPPKRRLGPQTARERAEERQTLREHDDIASQLLGTRYTRRYSNHRG